MCSVGFRCTGFKVVQKLKYFFFVYVSIKYKSYQMLPKLFHNRLVLNSFRPAVAHEAQVEHVHISLILWVVYSYGITNNLMSKCISEKLYILEKKLFLLSQMARDSHKSRENNL